VSELIDQSLSSILERTFRGRRILVTGHNGFVGSWLSLILANAGAQLTGLSLPSAPGCLSDSLALSESLTSIEGDVTIPATVQQVVEECAPEFVFHLAAQALVFPSYTDPGMTFATNVMGTVNVLDSLRQQQSVRSCVIVTSDKCYSVVDGVHVETDPLGGDDPYSASKAAAEIVAHAYRVSFFEKGQLGLATARAGNIVGGGDWAEYRIVPDLARAVRDGIPVVLRQPDAIRPWQHVLDAVAGYLRLSDALVRDRPTYSQAWNFGPNASAAANVGELVKGLVDNWRSKGDLVREPTLEKAPVRERVVLALDSDKAHRLLGWNPLLDLDTTIDWTVDWYREAINSSSFNARDITNRQIVRFLEIDRATKRGEASLAAGFEPIVRD